jgi:hypothetical protein
VVPAGLEHFVTGASEADDAQPGHPGGAQNVLWALADLHVQAERAKDDDDDGAAGVLVPAG